MTVGLAMLVKDEAENLAETLQRILPVVDHCTIIDTGSSDDTIEALADSLDGFPHRIHERPWNGFGPNRTELLALARPHSNYVLMLDADHTLHIEGEQPDLDADAYMLRIRDDGGRLPLLTRSGHPFEYRGVAHAYLHSDQPPHEEPLDWLSIDGGPGASRDKLEGDRVLLEQAFLDDPTDARTVFYLAQTYRDLDMPVEAIAFYRLRAEMGGWSEETYWARHQLGCLLSEHVSFAQGAPELLRAFTDRPTRMESLRALANAAAAVADKTAAPDDRLFLQLGAYGA